MIFSVFLKFVTKILAHESTQIKSMEDKVMLSLYADTMPFHKSSLSMHGSDIHGGPGTIPRAEGQLYPVPHQL